MASVDTTVIANNDIIDTIRILIPKTDTYKLPIPKAAFFGKQKFSITLSESGAVTSIGYGKTAGTTGTLNALGEIASLKIAEVNAASLKAKAGVIAQQQRLVHCQAKPDECK